MYCRISALCIVATLCFSLFGIGRALAGQSVEGFSGEPGGEKDAYIDLCCDEWWSDDVYNGPKQGG